MKHTNSLDSLAYQKTWLTIGVFDGIHRGHQVLLETLVAGAHANGCPAVVLTFHPHPAVALGGRLDFKCLTTPEERLTLLEALGVDVVITQFFDAVFARQTAEAFMRRVHHVLGLEQLFVGYDFALGRDRLGDQVHLAALGKSLGYRLVRIEPLMLDGTIISSTAIRTAIHQGDLAAAAHLLGRPYSLEGAVIHGDGRGRTLQYPTANIEYPQDKLIPPNGIYATWAWLRGSRHASATNIGTNPTFTPEKTSANVETHLLDYNGDLYGETIRLEFVQRLRDELKFDSVEALVKQIDEDVIRTRWMLTPPG